MKNENGYSLIELLITIGLAAILLPALFAGFFATRGGRAQQGERIQALNLLKEGQEAARVAREGGWNTFAPDCPAIVATSVSTKKATPTPSPIPNSYHPIVFGGSWVLSNTGPETIGAFTRSLSINPVYRNSAGDIVDVSTAGRSCDPSTKLVTVKVSWGMPFPTTLTAYSYLSRFINKSYTETTQADFGRGQNSSTQITNTGGGEVILAKGA
ncbi:MAG TPA: type II secretion system protein, partial [Patescibacteria group bacterium]|nr:type II secretion system protein [Patescibacteria group bacterium]